MMSAKFWKFSPFKVETGVVAFSTLLVIFLRLLGGLQFLEWRALDLFFTLRPAEPIDDRIILVLHEEGDLQIYEESIVSDRTLNSLIEKISAQEPAVIGLDLYRDIKEISPQLTDEQNEQAYQQLQKTFAQTPNLVGIEKVRPPYVRPPKTLKENGRVAAAEILPDADGIVRRAYIQPVRSDDPSLAIPGLGAFLAQGYLTVTEGIVPEERERLKLGETTFPPFQPNDGGYVSAYNRSYDNGYQTLVNWRKEKFQSVSFAEVLSDRIPNDLFRNRLVLIGNVNSISDQFYLPFSRWSGSPPEWTHGVKVHAQIASYIISSTLDGRPTIKVLPDWADYLLIAGCGLGIVGLSRKWQKRSSSTFVAAALLGSAAISSVLFIGSYGAFLWGWWIPFVPAVASTLLAGCTFIIGGEIIRQRQIIERQQDLIGAMEHRINTPFNNIKNSAEYLDDLRQELDNVRERLYEWYEDDFRTWNPKMEELVSKIDQQIKNIRREGNTVSLRLEQIAKLLKLNDFSYGANKELIDVNQLVREVIKEEIEKRQNFHDSITINVEEMLEEKPLNCKVAKLYMKEAIGNLLNNAYTAVVEKSQQQNEEYTPLITVETKDKGKYSEITVADNGVGICQGNLDRIFVPFYSTRIGKGQGLGLCLAEKIAKMHKGKISFTSQEGEGSRFELKISKG